MYTDAELKWLKGAGYELLEPLNVRKAHKDRLSLQDILAHRRYTDLDYERSFFFFIERGRYHIRTDSAILAVAAYDVRLIYPWPSPDEPQPPHPGMCAMQAAAELAHLLGMPFSRRTHQIMLDAEPYVLIDKLKAYLDRPDLRIAFDVAY